MHHAVAARAGRGRRAGAGRARRRHVDAGRNRGDAGPDPAGAGVHRRRLDPGGGVAGGRCGYAERVLLIDYDGPHPHTLLAQLCQVGGLMIDKLVVLEPGVATGWDELCEPTDVPMPMRQAPVTDVLGDLAHALRVTDMTWPRNDDEDFLDTRAWACPVAATTCPTGPCRAARTATPPTDPGLRHQDSGRDDQVSRSLAELLLDYGEGYIGAGPCAGASARSWCCSPTGYPARASSTPTSAPPCPPCCAGSRVSPSPNAT